MVLCFVLIALWRLTHGEMRIPASEVFRLLLSGSEEISPQSIVVRSVRLPRLLSALGTGASLAVSGVVLQGVLQNPLAEPYTLGIASGAAFGGALVFSLSVFAVVAAAFAGALFSLCAVYILAKHAGGGRLQIVLSGGIVSAFLSAGVTLLKAISGERLNAIVLWLMGGFSGATPHTAALVWFFAVVSLAISWAYGRQIDAMSLGEDAGSLLGVDEKKLRNALLCVVSLASAASVSFFGIIGFVGLVVPHLLRLAIGAPHRPLLFCSFLSGAVLMASADGAAQMCSELPVSVVTAIIGVPCFCWIMIRRREVAG
jgi:iron complex transport system permease protein